ncbi:MAG: hypothetical protein WB781_29520, partial [Candidatus Sulfotelmatobacter sp.]
TGRAFGTKIAGFSNSLLASVFDFCWTIMHIEFAPQVLLRSNSVTRERGWSEELPLTLRARRQRRNFALVPDDDEAAISVPARNADWGKAQTRFKLLRDRAEFCSVRECIA